MNMSKSNAGKVADLAPNPADVPILPFIADNNPTVAQCKDAVNTAFDLLMSATTLNVNIPAADGDTEVDVISDDQNGEVEKVRVKVANRYGRMQRGLADSLLRQLDFSIKSALDEIAGIKKDVRSAVENMQRSEDPSRARDFIESKTRWADVIRDQVGHAQMLRDTLADTYFAHFGRPYVPYEKREKRQVQIAAPGAGQTLDPVLAAAKALLDS
jgi:hypothetical protein